MSVRVAGVDAPDRRGGWSTDVEQRLSTLETPVRGVLEPHVSSLTATDRITIVPDAHYPFHPSSGMVTDPAVVASIVEHLERWTDADVAVAGATDERIAFDRTADYLSYPAIFERFDAELVDLADEERREVVHRVDGEQVSVSVPERLLESTVVAVPTLRPTESGPVAGGMRALGRLASSVADAEPTAVAATRAIEPALSVLDATTAYGGEPIAADALFAGPTPQVDAIAASLLERPVEEDPVLRAAVGPAGAADAADGPDAATGDEPSIAVERGSGDVADVDLTALRRRLPDGELPPPDGMHPLVTTAYRLYAAVAGDAVPPQFESRR